MPIRSSNQPRILTVRRDCVTGASNACARGGMAGFRVVLAPSTSAAVVSGLYMAPRSLRVEFLSRCDN